MSFLKSSLNNFKKTSFQLLHFVHHVVMSCTLTQHTAAIFQLETLGYVDGIVVTIPDKFFSFAICSVSLRGGRSFNLKE
jgi:hypothetical protein